MAQAEVAWRAKVKALERKELELGDVLNQTTALRDRLQSENAALLAKIQALERSPSPTGARPKPGHLTWRQFANELAFEQKELVDQIMAVGFYRQRQAVKGTVKL